MPDVSPRAEVAARLRSTLSPHRAPAATTASDQPFWWRHSPDARAALFALVGAADAAVSAPLELRPADPHPRNLLLGRRRRAGVGQAQPLPRSPGVRAGAGDA